MGSIYTWNAGLTLAVICAIICVAALVVGAVLRKQNNAKTQSFGKSLQWLYIIPFGIGVVASLVYAALLSEEHVTSRVEAYAYTLGLEIRDIDTSPFNPSVTLIGDTCEIEASYDSLGAPYLPNVTPSTTITGPEVDAICAIGRPISSQG